ncbi:DUF2249 domain-containing protein [Rhodocyclus gracilis]|uniref:DUF2249 domain-containing protein n=1 Tax=Rhodocyclus gracilis TaxID=2929842 RepID=UPI0030F3D89C
MSASALAAVCAECACLFAAAQAQAQATGEGGGAVPAGDVEALGATEGGDWIDSRRRALGADAVLDARGLEPPEPFVRTFEALDALPPEGKLLLLLPREPRPLYRALTQHGYAWRTTPTAPGIFEILIARRMGEAG